MVEKTITKEAGKEGIEKAVMDMLVENTKPEQLEVEPIIDSTKFAEVNMQYFMLAKAAVNVFSDPQLLECFNNKNDSIEFFNALVTADNYLKKNDHPELKELIIKTAQEGDTQKILNLITTKNKGMLNDSQVEEYLKSRIPQFLSESKDEIGLTEFKVENIDGKLGIGTRLSSKDSFFEHRKIGDDYTLRIMNDGNGYKVILHTKKVKGDDFYEGYKKLLDVTNSVLKTKESISIDDFVKEACEKKDELKLGDGIYSYHHYVKKNIWNASVGNISVVYNKSNNFLEKEGMAGYPKFFFNLDMCNAMINGVFGGVGALISLGFGIFGHNWTAFPYLLGATALGWAPILSCGITNDENFGFHAMAIKKREKDGLNKYLLTDESIKAFAKEHKIYYESLKDVRNLDQLNSLRSGRDKKYNKLSTTFGHLRDAQGFVLEFRAESLEGAYEKVYQVIELLKK